MIQISAPLAAALNSTANKPLDLYELYLDSGTRYYSTEAITWGGHDYLPFVKSRSDIRRADGPQFDDVSITLSNVNTQIAQILVTEEIEGRSLVIRKIDRTVAGDSIVLFSGRLNRLGSLDEERAEITATSILGSIDNEGPGRTFTTSCGLEFKGVACGYSGPETVCDHSWSQCAGYANTPRYGGFRFIPHTGLFQYTEVETKRFLLLFSRKKKTNKSAAFSSVDDTPYDIPLPIILGRVLIDGIVIQHADAGGELTALVAFCVGPVEQFDWVRANQVLVADWTPHIGQFGGGGSQLVDSRFPNAYEYNLVAYIGLTIPSEASVEDSAPTVSALVHGCKVAIFDGTGAQIDYAWSDNPIWNVRHFMTLARDEGGMGLPETLFDDVVHAAEAAYCDSLITDASNDQKIFEPTVLPPEQAVGAEYRIYQSTGVDGVATDVDGPYDVYSPGVDDDTSRAPVSVQVKRFTLNAPIVRSEKLVDILYRKLLPAFRGYITESAAGKLQIRVERPVANTTLSSGSSAGASTINVASETGFAAGQLVLVGALTATAEVRTVQSVGSGTITFTAPLGAAHGSGDVVHLVHMDFGDSNIVGKVEYPLEDRQSSVNRITIKYSDAPKGFEPQQLQVNDYEHQAAVFKTNNEDVDGSGIDSYFQAWRIGQYLRAKRRDLGKFISFSADIKATLLEVGDVATVSTPEHGLQAVPFRVIEIGYRENDEVAIVGQVYSIGVYDDTAPQTTLKVPAVFNAAPGVNVPAPGPISNFTGVVVDESDPALDVITGQADLPAVLNDFDGCETYITVGASSPVPAGHQYHLPGAAGPFTFEFRIGRPDGAETWRIWFCSRNADTQAPLVMAAGPDQTPYIDVNVTARPSTSGATPPAQVVEASIVITIPEYRTSQGGLQVADIRVNYTDPIDANYVEAWVYQGASPPSDPKDYAFRGVAQVGHEIQWWEERPEAGATYWCAVTASKLDFKVVPGASTPKKDFALTAWAMAPQVTAFAVTVIPDNAGGTDGGRYRFEFTPPADPEFWYASIDRIRCDNTYTPLVGADWEHVAGPRATEEQSDRWILPPAAEYWIFRAQSVNQAGDLNTVSAPTSNVMVPANTGINLSAADPASIGPGLAAGSGVLGIPAGGIVASMIGSVNAGAITGSILAGQIGSVNASAISGLIAASQIGSVNASAIAGTITASQIASVNAGAIVGTITSGQIASVSAGTITGSIVAGQIGSVNATAITGVIVTPQLADGILDTLRLMATDMRVIKRVASLPGLPDVNYPANSVVLRTSDKKLYKNVSGVWTAVQASDDLTGTLTSTDIVSVAATTITGLIIASQIGSVNASAIAGSITASQIASVNASAITGTITASQIASVNASAISGTISAAQIGSINAATITIGLIGNSQINDVNVSKLTVGTMTIGSGNVVFSGTGSLQVTGGGGISSGNVFGAIFSVSSIQTIGAVSIIDSSRNTNFNNLKWSSQLQGPYTADTGVSVSASKGKVAYYDTSGNFQGWLVIFN